MKRLGLSTEGCCCFKIRKSLWISQKVTSLWPVLYASDEMNEVFKDTKPLISFRRPRNLADNLVRSKIRETTNKRKHKGMKKCGKSRCQICSYVEEAEEFEYDNKKCWINYCDSEGVIPEPTAPSAVPGVSPRRGLLISY